MNVEIQRTRLVPWAAILGATCVAFGGAAQAQPASPDADERTLEEVLVTARKREESLLEIPESVVALGAGDIDRRNLKGLEDVGVQVPNLNLSVRLDGFPNVSVRGLGSFGNTQGVGFYLDDAQVFSDASSRFGDLARIEVLKGPQGTLYGGSNIGGAIKFVSARPDPEEAFGRVKALAGGQGVVDFEGSINAPLGDGGWAMRLFGFGVQNDGYLKNRNSPRVNGLRTNNDADVGASEERGARASIAGPLGERLSAYASVRWNDYEGPNNTWNRELDPSNLRYPDVIDTSTNPRHERQTTAGMLELVLELDQWDLLYLTSYTDTDSERYSDLDIREEYLLDLIRPEVMQVMTHEIRLTSTGDGPTQWLGGIYYSNYEETMDSELIVWDSRVIGDTFDGVIACAFVPGTCSGVWAGETIPLSRELENIRVPFELRDRDKSHVAAFGNVTHEFGAWELALGLRVDRWENASENRDTGISSKQNDTEVLPRASLTRWLGEDSMVYGTVAWGYEPGGYNLANFEGESELFGFEAEKATSYEFGWKGRWMDGRATASFAGFFIDYEARQIEYQINTPQGPVEGIINLGDSEQYGFEGEISVQVSDALRLSFAAGIIEAEWQSGTIVDGEDLQGETPPVTPDFSWNANADYRRALRPGLDVVAGLQISHNGSYEGLLAWNPVTNPDYTLVNAQVGVAAERWELMFNVENLADEEYYMDVQHFPNFYLLDEVDPIVIGTLGQPRLFTASLSYFF